MRLFYKHIYFVITSRQKLLNSRFPVNLGPQLKHFLCHVAPYDCLVKTNCMIGIFIRYNTLNLQLDKLKLKISDILNSDK